MVVEMKLIRLVTILFLTVLAACSADKSGSGGKEKPYCMCLPEKVVPELKPANPASKEDVKYYMDLMANNQFTIPPREAIFEKNLKNGAARPVSDEDRQKAIGNLTQDGLKVLKQIKDQCVLREATSMNTTNAQRGDALREGTWNKDIGTMGIESAGCVVGMDVQAEGLTTIEKVIGGQKSLTIYTSILANETETRNIQDLNLQSLLNLKSSQTQMKTSGVVMMGLKEGPMDSMEMQMQMNMTGSMNMELTNSDYIRGPVKLDMVLNSKTGKSQMQALYDFQTRLGAIRIVMIADENHQEIYINGERVGSSVIKSALPGSLTKFQRFEMPASLWNRINL